MSEGGGAVRGEVDRLLRALRFSRGFHLHVVVCDTPRLAAFALGEVARRLPELGRPGARLNEIPVDFSAPERGDWARKRLAEEVATALGFSSPEDLRREYVHVLDASRAMPSEEADWRAVLGQLNATRDLIATTLRGELLLVIPPWLEPVLHQAAPDLASIESGATVRLQEEVVPALTAAPASEGAAQTRDPLALRAEAAAGCGAAEAHLREGRLREARQEATAAARAAEAWRLLQPYDDDAAQAASDARWWEAVAWDALGNVPEAAAAFGASEAALRGAVALPARQPLLARRTARHARALARARRIPDALAAAERSMVDARATGDPRVCFEVGLQQLELLAQEGYLSQAMRESRELGDLAAELGEDARARLAQATGALSALASLPAAPAVSARFEGEPPPPGGPYDARWYVARPALETRARGCLRSAGTPLVLTGPPGAGKHWLARHLLSSVDATSQQVWVDLTAIQRPTLDAVAQAIVEAVSLEDADDSQPAPLALARARLKRRLEAAAGPLYVALDVPDPFARWDQWIEVERAMRAWVDGAWDAPWSRLRLLAIYPEALHRAMQADARASNSALRTVVPVGRVSASEQAELERAYRARLPAEERCAPGYVADVVRSLWRARRGGGPS